MRPVVFGEVLLDIFPDGTRVLGGAPFNVARHLHGFGLDPILITRVGADADGTAIIETLKRWSLDVSGIQTDSHHPTGTVKVQLQDGEPTFEILSDQAYDFIEFEPAAQAIEAARSPLLYSGTLALRSEKSSSALCHLREVSGLPSFVDLNLRSPWYTRAVVERECQRARWLKLNREELAWLIDRPELEQADLCQIGQDLLESMSLETLIVTFGPQGALLIEREKLLADKPASSLEVVDTVGAGDAFAAVMIKGLLRSSRPEAVLREAIQFSSSICRIRGAIPAEASFYATSHRQS